MINAWNMKCVKELCMPNKLTLQICVADSDAIADVTHALLPGCGLSFKLPQHVRGCKKSQHWIVSIHSSPSAMYHIISQNTGCNIKTTSPKITGHSL